MQWLAEHKAGGVLGVDFVDDMGAVVDVAGSALELLVVLELVPVVVVAVGASCLVGGRVVLALDGAVGGHKVGEALGLYRLLGCCARGQVAQNGTDDTRKKKDGDEFAYHVAMRVELFCNFVFL